MLLSVQSDVSSHYWSDRLMMHIHIFKYLNFTRNISTLHLTILSNPQSSKTGLMIGHFINHRTFPHRTNPILKPCNYSGNTLFPRTCLVRHRLPLCINQTELIQLTCF